MRGRTGDELKTLVDILRDTWQSVCFDLRENGFAAEMNMVLQIILLYGSGDLKNFNEKDTISESAKKNSDYFGISVQGIADDVREKIADTLKKWNVQFEDCSEAGDAETNAFMLGNGLFALNIKMVGEYLTVIRNKQEVPEDIMTVSLAEDDVLSQKVRQDPGTFIYTILLPRDKINESEETMLWLLNTVDPYVYADDLLSRWTGKISGLDNVDEESWDLLLKYGRMTCSADNILLYFKKSQEEITQPLIEYLNKEIVPEGIMLKDNVSSALENLRQPFFIHVIQCKDLCERVYERLMGSLNFVYSKGFSFSDISDANMKILFKLKVIRFTAKNIKDVEQNYGHLTPCFISYNLDEFRTLIKNGEKDAYREEIKQVIESGEIKESSVRSLLKYYEGDIQILDKWSDRLQAEIIESYLLEKDLPKLYQTYEKRGVKTRQVLREMSRLYAPEIAEYKIMLHVEVLERLLGNKDISEEVKKRVLISQMPYMDAGKILHYLNMVATTEREEWQRLLVRKQSKFSPTEENKAILKHLQKKKIISTYKYDEEHDKLKVFMPRKQFPIPPMFK